MDQVRLCSRRCLQVVEAMQQAGPAGDIQSALMQYLLAAPCLLQSLMLQTCSPEDPGEPWPLCMLPCSVSARCAACCVSQCMLECGLCTVAVVSGAHPSKIPHPAAGSTLYYTAQLDNTGSDGSSTAGQSSSTLTSPHAGELIPACLLLHPPHH